MNMYQTPTLHLLSPIHKNQHEEKITNKLPEVENYYLK